MRADRFDQGNKRIVDHGLDPLIGGHHRFVVGVVHSLLVLEQVEGEETEAYHYTSLVGQVEHFFYVGDGRLAGTADKAVIPELGRIGRVGEKPPPDRVSAHALKRIEKLGEPSLVHRLAPHVIAEPVPGHVYSAYKYFLAVLEGDPVVLGI